MLPEDCWTEVTVRTMVNGANTIIIGGFYNDKRKDQENSGRRMQFIRD